jgi:hypothetical protein
MEDIYIFLNKSLNYCRLSDVENYLDNDEYFDIILNFYESNKDNKLACHYLFYIYIYSYLIDPIKDIIYLEISADKNFARVLYNLGHKYFSGSIV